MNTCANTPVPRCAPLAVFTCSPYATNLFGASRNCLNCLSLILASSDTPASLAQTSKPNLPRAAARFASLARQPVGISSIVARSAGNDAERGAMSVINNSPLSAYTFGNPRGPRRMNARCGDQRSRAHQTALPLSCRKRALPAQLRSTLATEPAALVQLGRWSVLHRQ